MFNKDSKKKNTEVDRDEVPYSRGIRNYPNAPESSDDATYNESEQKLVGDKDRYDEAGHKIWKSFNKFEKA